MVGADDTDAPSLEKMDEVEAAFGVDDAEGCVSSGDDEAEESAEVVGISGRGASTRTGLSVSLLSSSSRGSSGV